MSTHPLGPAAEHHVKTQGMVTAMRRRAAQDIVRDLEQCTVKADCPSSLHYKLCPVHP